MFEFVSNGYLLLASFSIGVTFGAYLETRKRNKLLKTGKCVDSDGEEYQILTGPVKGVDPIITKSNREINPEHITLSIPTEVDTVLGFADSKVSRYQSENVYCSPKISIQDTDVLITQRFSMEAARAFPSFVKQGETLSVLARRNKSNNMLEALMISNNPAHVTKYVKKLNRGVTPLMVIGIIGFSTLGVLRVR